MDAPAAWRFRIEGPDGTTRTVPVTRDLIIGRDPEADLRLNDSSVSRRHAAVTLERGALFIEDLGAANGVLVDESRIAGKMKVRNGSTLRLGLYTLIAERLGGEATIDPDGLQAKRGSAGKGGAKGAKAGDDDAEVLPSQPVLRFKSGPLAGKDIPLIRREMVLGRIAEGNDIVVPDESVSRKHLEFNRVGAGYAVRDLQSVNGTSVNGARIVTQPLRAGDVLKIGMIEAEYLGPNAQIARPINREALKRIIVASAALLLVLVVALGFKAWKAAHPTIQKHEDDRSAERSLVEAQNARRDERWDRALQAYQEALALDPVNQDARKGIREVKSEMDMKLLFERSRQRVDVGQDEEGMDIYVQIVPSSIYYPRARAEVHRLADLLKRRYDEECRESLREKDLQGIALRCGHYLNMVCNSPPVDQDRLKAVRSAEQRLGAKNRAPPWRCPTATAKWFSEDNIQAPQTQTQRIAEKYKNPNLAKAVKMYADGQQRQALKTLNQLKLTAAEAHDPELERLQKDMELAAGDYNDGVAAASQNDWITAKRRWDDFAEVDVRIMPPGELSSSAQESKRQLAKHYFRSGHDKFNSLRYEDAFRDWEAGTKVLPDDGDLNQLILDLENKAQSILASDPGCSDLERVLNMTRPNNINHRKAEESSKEKKCR